MNVKITNFLSLIYLTSSGILILCSLFLLSGVVNDVQTFLENGRFMDISQDFVGLVLMSFCILIIFYMYKFKQLPIFTFITLSLLTLGIVIMLPAFFWIPIALWFFSPYLAVAIVICIIEIFFNLKKSRKIETNKKESSKKLNKKP